MVDKLKKQFIPIDYEVDLFKKMQGLKQARRSVQEYTEEFYRLLIRDGHVEVTRRRFLIISAGCDLASRRN